MSLQGNEAGTLQLTTAPTRIFVGVSSIAPVVCQVIIMGGGEADAFLVVPIN